MSKYIYYSLWNMTDGSEFVTLALLFILAAKNHVTSRCYIRNETYLVCKGCAWFHDILFKLSKLLAVLFKIDVLVFFLWLIENGTFYWEQNIFW